MMICFCTRQLAMTASCRHPNEVTLREFVSGETGMCHEFDRW